jgi:hypothetical protein
MFMQIRRPLRTDSERPHVVDGCGGEEEVRCLLIRNETVKEITGCAEERVEKNIPKS